MRFEAFLRGFAEGKWDLCFFSMGVLCIGVCLFRRMDVNTLKGYAIDVETRRIAFKSPAAI